VQLLKIYYEKYFSGIERLEPAKEREALRRKIRELDRTHFPNRVQRYRYQTMRARFVSLDQYIQRNLFMIERGTHPRFRFRADLADRAQGLAARRVSDYEQRRITEEATYREVYERYIDARRGCGQHTELEFQRVRTAIRNQVRLIKSRYKCGSVRFRVQVEDGRARIKALPQR